MTPNHPAAETAPMDLPPAAIDAMVARFLPLVAPRVAAVLSGLTDALKASRSLLDVLEDVPWVDPRHSPEASQLWEFAGLGRAVAGGLWTIETITSHVAGSIPGGEQAFLALHAEDDDEGDEGDDGEPEEEVKPTVVLPRGGFF